MSPPGKPTYRSLQAGRGIAAILVVFFHTAFFMRANPRYWHLKWLSQRLAGLALGVEYFFVLSGAVILLAHCNDLGHPATLPSYLWKRFRRVYPIYWLVLLALVLAYTLRPHLGDPYQRDPWVIVSGILLVHLRSVQTNLPVAWTLFHEVLFYLVFASALASRKLGAALLAAWFAGSIAVFFLPWTFYFTTYLFSPLHLLFGFGMAVAWLLRNRTVPAPRLLVLAGSSIFVAAILWAGLRGEISDAIGLLAGTGTALLVLGAARLEQQGSLAVPQPALFLGDASYSIYLIHYPCLMLCVPWVYTAWRTHPIPLFIPFVILSTLAVAAGACMHVLLERPLLKFLQSVHVPHSSRSLR